MKKHQKFAERPSRFVLRLEKDLAEKVKLRARQTDRSMNDIIRQCIVSQIDRPANR